MLNVSDVQGNILQGYRKPRVRHLILEIAGAGEARGWCGAIVSGGDDVPQVTSQAPWETKPVSCFNIGLTFEGLRALGVPDESLATFPIEFQQGMAARAARLGDVGESAPENWEKPLGTPDVHIGITALSPEGKVFVRGEYWDAVAPQPVVSGARVRVTAIQNLKLTVESVTDRNGGSS